MTKSEWESETLKSGKSTIDLPAFKVPTDKSRSLYKKRSNTPRLACRAREDITNRSLSS